KALLFALALLATTLPFLKQTQDTRGGGGEGIVGSKVHSNFLIGASRSIGHLILCFRFGLGLLYRTVLPSSLRGDKLISVQCVFDDVLKCFSTRTLRNSGGPYS